MSFNWYMFWTYRLSRISPFNWIDDAYQWVRYRTYNRFHCVNMGETLKPGYYDIDIRMLHANFTLLCSYVEKEMDIIDWTDSDESKHVKKEIDELYFWWKNVFPHYDDNNPLFAKGVKCTSEFVKCEDGSGMSKLTDVGSPEQIEKWKTACKDSFEYEEKMYKEIEDNLIRLIKIRRCLWS